MSEQSPVVAAAPQGARRRRLVCERCGEAFDCTLDGPCWCAREPYRMPLPRDGEPGAPADCLCPACLRARASVGGNKNQE